MLAVVAYPFTHRNGSHQRMCVISLSYIFCVFQHWNLLEKGFFCRRFYRWEGPLQENFLQIKVEEDLKFLLAQIMLKYSKKLRETSAAPRVFARWARVDHSPLIMREAIPATQRLSITLRYLASGNNLEDLKFMRAIVPQTLELTISLFRVSPCGMRYV